MDFVVSKVAMSICVLMVASILAGVYREQAVVDDSSELRGLLMRLTDLINTYKDASAESTIRTEVPSMVKGEKIDVEVSCSYMVARSGTREVFAQSPDGVHTWFWLGEPLNNTVIAERDARAAPANASTGGCLLVMTRLAIVENDARMLVFVHGQA